MIQEDQIKPDTAWLTLNRECNFRCPWCYAEDTKYSRSDNMPHELATRIIDLCREIGVKDIALIGGEPTLWPHLMDAIEYIHDNSIDSTLITNGYFLSDACFSKRIADSSLTSVAISLKAANPAQHRALTKNCHFDLVLAGIENALAYRKHVSLSVTLNQYTTNLIEFARTAADLGVSRLTVDFCSVTFRDGHPQRGFMLSPVEAVNCILDSFDAMNEIMDGGIYISQSLPSCLWPPDFVARLEQNNQIGFGCSILSQKGIVFDQTGNLLLCNCMHGFPVARYGADFFEGASFMNVWFSPEIRKIYERLSHYPHQRCISCDKYSSCAGGCPLQWFIFDPVVTVIRNKEFST